MTMFADQYMKMFSDHHMSASKDEMRAEANHNLATIKPDDSYMAADVLVLSQWIIALLDEADT